MIKAGILFVCLSGVPLIAHAFLFGWFEPDNYPECILEEMPGTYTDIDALEIIQKCSEEFPGNERVKKESGMNAVQCINKHTKNLKTLKGADAIRSACYQLYRS